MVIGQPPPFEVVFANEGPLRTSNGNSGNSLTATTISPVDVFSIPSGSDLSAFTLSVPELTATHVVVLYEIVGQTDTTTIATIPVDTNAALSSTQITTSTASSSDPTDQKAEHHSAAIVGGVISGIIILVVGMLLLVLWNRRRRHRDDAPASSTAGVAISPFEATESMQAFGPRGEGMSQSRVGHSSDTGGASRSVPSIHPESAPGGGERRDEDMTNDGHGHDSDNATTAVFRLHQDSGVRAPVTNTGYGHGQVIDLPPEYSSL
ncbi:hypothetical protein GYMLUDRAFT_93679 [Collybiopsis luxurians FD-317 M1]|nr:hypothetical protein GYMLUDRAFT_93679 [Collybiopsis luxurians FD-317 M1]